MTKPCCGLAVILCGFISLPIGRETINVPEIFSGVHGFMGKTIRSASGSRTQLTEETELSNYECLRVVVGDTVLHVVPAHSEMIRASKVPDKCDGGLAILEPTLDFVQQSKLLVDRSLVKIDGPIPISLLSPTSYPRQVRKSAVRNSGWKSGRTVFEAVSGVRDGCNFLESLSPKNVNTKIQRALYPCKFTLTKDVTLNRCCLRKFLAIWIWRRLGQHLCTQDQIGWWKDYM